MRLSPPSRFDFAGWVAANLTVEFQSGDEWICQCPRCDRPKLAINVRRHMFQCWVCKFSGRTALPLIAAVLNLDGERLDAYVATGTLGVADTTVEPLIVAKKKRGVIPVAPLPPGTAPLQGSAEAYARNRAISAEHAGAFGLSSVLGDGTGSIADRLLTGRLLIPAYDLRSRLVYWVARATDGHDIKTFNLPRADRHEPWGLSPVEDCATRSEVLVGLHLLKRGGRAIVVEGPMDAVVCGAGFVATLGASLSLEQAILIASSGVTEAVILYDPDEAGAKGAAAAYSRLSPFIPTRIAHCPAQTDPADLGRSGALAVVEATASEGVGILPLGRGKPDCRRVLRQKIGEIEGLKKL